MPCCYLDNLKCWHCDKKVKQLFLPNDLPRLAFQEAILSFDTSFLAWPRFNTECINILPIHLAFSWLCNQVVCIDVEWGEAPPRRYDDQLLNGPEILKSWFHLQ
jgi:hypothetical protein